MVDIPNEKLSLIKEYFQEFKRNYYNSEQGKKHLDAYQRERELVSGNWELAKQIGENDPSLTNFVLYRLLPYANTRFNREKGNYVSIAPAITKDIKTWFEGAGWQESGNWPTVARAIFDLIKGLIDEGRWESLNEFEENHVVSNGIRTGILTPTFYALNKSFRIVNNKTIDTVKYITKRTIVTNRLSEYKNSLEIIDQIVNTIGIEELKDNDVFDIFSHWMCDKRLGGYARIEESQRNGEDESIDLPSSIETEEKPGNHWEAIYYLAKSGNILGFDTYVADPSREAFNQKLSDVATLREIPEILSGVSDLKRVDAIWYDKTRHKYYLFEVEDGGTMRDALHRLYNAIDYNSTFYIVCPEENKSKFERWVNTSPFRENRGKYNFRTYGELWIYYCSLRDYTELSKKFLN